MAEQNEPQVDESLEEQIAQEQEKVKAIADEARENFTLTDLFGGRASKLPTKKSLIFRDAEAVKELNAATMRLDTAKNLKESLDPKDKSAAGKKRVKEVDEFIAKTEAEVEEARAKALETALSFHLRAHHNIAVKVAKREARKIFLDPDTGEFRDGVTQDEISEWMDERLLGESIQAVYTSDGERVEFGVPKSEIGAYLSNNMEPLVWHQLLADYQELARASVISRSAVEDPGF